MVFVDCIPLGMPPEALKEKSAEKVVSAYEYVKELIVMVAAESVFIGHVATLDSL
jgi:hypothetical protein